jgi:hypothetical protein
MEDQRTAIGSLSPFPSLKPGNVVDVATPSSKRLRALGTLWAVISVFPLLLLNYVIIEAFSSAESILSTRHPVELAGIALMPLIAWVSLGNAIQRFHAAKTAERHFRAGPRGISVCLPDDSGKTTLLFAFKTLKFELPWDQVKTWYPYVQSMNGIPTERSIVFETLSGEKIKIKTYHFAERQKQIVENITKARSTRPPIAECSAEVAGSATAKPEPFRLPPGTGDLSIQIKKKKEPVKEIDLKTVPLGQRAAYVTGIADLLEAKLLSLCPLAAGFKLSRKRYRPIKGRDHIFGLRIHVRRGLLDGYEIQIEPNDAEYRTLVISMCSSSLIDDIRRYVTMGVGAVAFLASIIWMGTIEHWLGQFAQLTPFVLLAILLATLGLCAALLQAPISLLRLMRDKQNDAAQKSGIKAGIQEVLV